MIADQDKTVVPSVLLDASLRRTAKSIRVENIVSEEIPVFIPIVQHPSFRIRPVSKDIKWHGVVSFYMGRDWILAMSDANWCTSWCLIRAMLPSFDIISIVDNTLSGTTIIIVNIVDVCICSVQVVGWHHVRDRIVVHNWRFRSIHWCCLPICWYTKVQDLACIWQPTLNAFEMHLTITWKRSSILFNKIKWITVTMKILHEKWKHVKSTLTTDVRLAS